MSDLNDGRLRGADPFTEAMLEALRSDFEPKLKSWLFISGLWRIPHWIIAADFVFDGPNRYKNMAFTIMPMFPDIEFIIKNAGKNLPKDIKKTSEISEGTLRWLINIPAIHVGVLFRKNLNIFEGSAAYKETFRNEMGPGIKRMRKGGRDKDHIASFEALRQAMQARNFNFRFLSDIHVMVFMFMCLEALLRKNTRCKGVILFPDRDNMTTAYKGVFKAILAEIRAMMMTNNGFDDAEYKFGIGVVAPEHFSRPAWFDPLIRIPDWIAGALSVIDPLSNNFTPVHPKIKTILEDVISSSNKFSGLLIERHSTGCRFPVLRLNKRGTVK